MDFYAILDQVVDLLRQRQRVTYRALTVQFHLDDEALEALKDELLYAHPEVRDDAGRGLVWMSDPLTTPEATSTPAEITAQAPLAYTPPYLTEQILTSRSALEGERKQITVLFADLKGSMELLADRDPEEARQLLDPVLERMMAAVHRYEGTVNQVMGDGIMALFGAPLAHEDHAVRACYAALAMQAAVGRYAEEVRRAQGLVVQMRVGLNSGEVVVRAISNDLHMDYSAIGQTTHFAARVEQLARPGTTLLTRETLRLVEGLVQVTALGPIPFRGVAEPVEVFELIGASALRGHFQAGVVRGLTRFVGRDHELAALRHAQERAGAGQGQVVAVVGEAGVGKSRLVYEFVHSHYTPGWLVLQSASVSYGKATPYFPVIDLLKRYSHVAEHDDTRTIRAKVTGQVLTLDPALQDTVPALLLLLDALPEDSPFWTLDPPQRRQRTLDALKRVLLRESQVQPLLLVFEDLHWIDSEMQALLEHLVESLPPARILLLVNYRPEYQHGWGSKTYYTQLRLDPLPPASAAEVLAAFLGDDLSLAPLTHLLIARTEGNPFFLEESVRTLVETGVLVGEIGACRLAKPLESLQIPATVQAVLAVRIDRLPPEAKRLLQTAAVIGSEVSLPLLQAIAELPEVALHRGLRHLQAAEFLYETYAPTALAYTFKHVLTQEVAYQSLVQRVRQQYHARIAQVLEERFPEKAEIQPELLAYHYTEADRGAQAIPYWQRAGRRAVERSANVEAISHFTKGLELLKILPDTPERAQQELTLQLAMGSPLLMLTGHTAPEVEHAYARAYELAQQIGDGPQRFSALIGLWRFYFSQSRLERARELAEQCFTLAQCLQDVRLLQEAHMALGSTLLHLGEHIAARASLEQGIALYDPQHCRILAFSRGSDPGVACLARVAWTLWFLGYAEQALARSHEALALAKDMSHAYSLAFALHLAGVLHQCRREVQVVQAWAEAEMVLSSAQGFLYWSEGGMIRRGWALVQQGALEEGIAQLRQGLNAWLARGNNLGKTHVLARLAEAYGKAGQPAEGLSVLAEALAAVRNHAEHLYEAELYRLKGELLLQSGVRGLEPEDCPSRMAEVEACFRQALDIAHHQQAKSLELRAAMSLARLWQAQGKRVEACQMLTTIYSWFTEGFDTPDLQEAKALLAALA